MRNMLLRLLKLYVKDSIKLVAATYYVRAVREVRCAFIIGVLVTVGLLLMLAGFVLMHLAIFVFMPWSDQAKAVVLLLLGALYFIVPAMYVVKVCSEKFWMTRTRASRLVDEVTSRK